MREIKIVPVDMVLADDVSDDETHSIYVLRVKLHEDDGGLAMLRDIIGRLERVEKAVT